MATDTVKELRSLSITMESKGIPGAVLCEIASHEIERLRRIIYKLQMPESQNKFPPEVLTADELAAYKAAVVACI